MTMAYSGGCACGEIRYEIRCDPIVQSHCQCRHCQQRSGTGHGSYLVFTGRGEAQITGQPSTWRLAGDSGAEKIHAFCPTCGSPVFLTFVAMPDLIAVHAASLDEPGRFAPQMVTYGISGHGWDTIDPALTIHPRMPSG